MVNLKGFVAIPWDNNGQDLGWEIILDPDNFMDKYSLKSGRPGVTRFRVVRETPGASGAEFYVEIAPRTVHALRLADSRGQSLLIPWVSGGSYRLPQGQYVLEDAWSNGSGSKAGGHGRSQAAQRGRRLYRDLWRPAGIDRTPSHHFRRPRHHDLHPLAVWAER